MWRLLPALLLVSCATQGPNDSTTEGQSPDGSRIVRTLDVPLNAVPADGAGQPVTREFQGRDVSGRIDESGTWTIRTKVVHSRLRCATYETGIQLGRGNAGCADAEWSGPVQFGTRQTQCNSAAVIHTGGDELALPQDAIEGSNCVRVLTRCTGAC